MKKRLLTLSLILIVFAISAEVSFAKDYIVELKSGVEAEGLEPIGDGSLGIYTADEETVKDLEDKIKIAVPDVKIPLCDTQLEGTDSSLLWQYNAVDYARMTENFNLSGRIRVGVIDSGVFAEHPDIGTVLGGKNYLDYGEITDTSDTMGHGTACAGIITSINPNAEILPLRCFDANGGSVVDILDAMLLCADNGCKIINISAGVEKSILDAKTHEIFQKVVNKCEQQGVLVVAASGNTGKGVIKSSLVYPAAYDNVLSVASVNNGFETSSFSVCNSMVDVAAPGGEVIVMNNTMTLGRYYACKSGTSYAAPFASALASLVFMADQSMTPKRCTAIMQYSSRDFGESGRDDSYGSGVIDIYEAIALALDTSDIYLAPLGTNGNKLNFAVYNFGNSTVNHKLITATYSENGVLNGITIEDISVASLSVFSGSNTIEHSDDVVVKKYIWNGLIPTTRKQAIILTK